MRRCHLKIFLIYSFGGLPNILRNNGSSHYAEHFCEIIFNLESGARRDVVKKAYLI